jgi:hypothetical protein
MTEIDKALNHLNFYTQTVILTMKPPQGVAYRLTTYRDHPLLLDLRAAFCNQTGIQMSYFRLLPWS